MELSLNTRCIHGSPEYNNGDVYRAVSEPLYLTSTFAHRPMTPDGDFSHEGVSTGFTYTRQSNPTRHSLEKLVASLEGAYGCMAVSSGMAAVYLVFELFSPGDHILCSEDVYGGTERLFAQISRKNGLVTDFADTTRPDCIRQAIHPETKAIFVETPSNPMMQVTDLRECARIASEHGLLLIVDNTFLSPYFQNPLALGADIVIHSGTKFLCGHNDVVAGLVCCKSRQLDEQIRLLSVSVGNALSPFDSWLLIRGIKTLAVRMNRQQETSGLVAEWLKDHPRIRQVYYVGLADHPGYDIQRSQSRGAGCMISFRTDTVETAKQVLSRLKLIQFAESLGGTESLITYPVSQTHTEVPEQKREQLGITETLLRFSVGLEDPEDLIRDLSQALDY